MKKVISVCAGILLAAGIAFPAVAESARRETFGERDAQALAGLDISVPCAFLKIETGETLEVRTGSVIGEQVRMEMEDGILRIWDPGSPGVFSFSGRRGDTRQSGGEQDGLTLSVVLPDDREYQKMDLSVGMGECAVGPLRTASFSARTFSARLTLDGVRANRADIQSDTGQTDARGLCVDESFALAAGDGACAVEGDLTGEVEIRGGSGTARLELERGRGDYDIRADAGGGGALTIDGRRFDRFKRDWHDDGDWKEEGKNETENSLLVSNGSGSITICFDGE